MLFYYTTLVHFQNKSDHDDSDGFQEVKSEMNVKESQKDSDTNLIHEDTTSIQGSKSTPTELPQQEESDILSSMGISVVRSAFLLTQPSNKYTYNRYRNKKLPPRFAKRREQCILQNTQMRQHNLCDAIDVNKMNQSSDIYGTKDNFPIQMNACTDSIQLRDDVENDVVPIHSPARNSGSLNTEKVGNLVLIEKAKNIRGVSQD